MQSSLWKKLQFKGASLIVHNSPSSFEDYLSELPSSCAIFKKFDKKSYSAAFTLCFVTSKAEVDSVAQHISKLEGDPLVWFAYLKGTSKLRSKTSDISRDKGFESLATVDFEPVSSAAIDSDWTALRFRRVTHIKVMMRQFAKTEEGKAKVSKSRAEGKSCIGMKNDTKQCESEPVNETKKRKRN